MPRFKNISEIAPDTCKILIYKMIDAENGVGSAEIVEQLDWAAMYYKNCDVHINTVGGDVFEGIAIRKALQDNKMNITIYIDGIAASIGFLIAKCGRPIRMSRWARLMAHRVTGGCVGTADDLARSAVDVQSVENDLISILAEETKSTPSEIKNKWFDGTDHWITSTEALSLGIITDIYDGVKVEEPSTGNVDAASLYNKFNNILIYETMKWENFFKRANLRNEATEQDAIDNYAALEKRATDAEAAKTAAEAKNKELQDKLDAKEKADADAIEADNETVITNAQNEGRFKAEQRESFKNLLKANRKDALVVINSLPKAKKLIDQLGGSGEKKGREDWSFRDYSEKDPASLQALKQNEPAEYKRLFKAQYGSEPKL
jgi:ATP-dependent protease ClpP protease subunit